MPAMPARARALSLSILTTAVLVSALALPTMVVAAPNQSASVLVSDTMQRTVANGWGTADSSGAWSKFSTTVASVHDGTGWIQSPGPGRTSQISLAASGRDVESRFSMMLPALPASGSGLYLAQGARVSEGGFYAAGVRVLVGGAIELTLEKRVGSKVTTLKRVRLALRASADQVLNVAFQAVGADPAVELRAKVWAQGAPEPAQWAAVIVDSSAGRVTAAGGVLFTLYTSSRTAALPIRIDDFVVKASDTSAVPPVTPPTPPVTPPTPPVTPPTPPVTPPTPPVTPPTPPVTPPTPPVTPGSELSPKGARHQAGAAAPGTADYAVPAGAVIVSPSGSDAGAGTLESPVRTIAAAIQKVPNGGTIALRGGTYHEFVIVPPQKRITIQPYRKEAVWLDGAESVTNWRKDGKVWVHDGWTYSFDSSPTFTRGAPDGTAPGWKSIDPAHPMASHPEQVWVGGNELAQVGSLQEVTNGSFFVDDKANRLVIGADPASGGIQATTLATALSIRAVGAVVKGIGVTRYATSVPDMGTVTVAANDVTVSDVTVRDNATTGLYTWSKNTTLSNVSVIGNGLMGAGASNADGLKVLGMLSVHNNDEHFNRAPVSGALKIHNSHNVVISGSVFADNYGQGPWFDISNYNIVFTGNDSLRNTGNGAVFEISDTVVVADNLVADNGIDGVLIVNTGNVAIWGNTLTGNVRNLQVQQDSRRSSNSKIPWVSKNIVVSNNVIAEPRGGCLVCVDDYSKAFTGSQMVTQSNGNLFHRASADAPRWFGIFAQGSAAASKTQTLAQFTSTFGRDAKSQLIEGASPVDATNRLTSAGSALQSTVALPIPARIADVSALVANAKTLGAVFR